ncbi:MAG: hypothetical protein MJ171_03130 [Clostridia bacterium]|nr:hypothetical protein [Clostridia bacterium]
MLLTVIGLFTFSLILCIILGINILAALIFGFVLFFSYGLLNHYSFKTMAGFALKGILTVKNILLTFILIGMLTALWRASGTIPVIITYTSRFIRPEIFLLAAFLLNGLVSFLIGTSFGTSATMGVITMTMGLALNINPVFLGGAILSGVFFGDRCSPVSTSALLVSEVTGTDIYDNIKRMFKIAAVPFIASCVIYLVLGFQGNRGSDILDVKSIFSESFSLNPLCLIPALVIVVLAIFRVKVKQSMAVSIVCAILICIFVQHMEFLTLLKLLLFGFEAEKENVAALLNGGGILSMKRVIFIICLSSSYSGMFEGTHMIDDVKDRISGMKENMPVFLAMLIVSITVCAVSCNQTLAIILTNQLTEKLEPDKEKRALMLEDGPTVIAPLIPWSIAGTVPLSACGAPVLSITLACYLYLLPVWHLMVNILKKDR